MLLRLESLDSARHGPTQVVLVVELRTRCVYDLPQADGDVFDTLSSPLGHIAS